MSRRSGGAVLLGVLLVAGWMASPAAAMRLGRFTLDPKNYRSPGGVYDLHVNPGTIYGQGAGEYRMTRDGDEVWARTLPFTLWHAVVCDDGTTVGYAYSGGLENYPLRDAAGASARAEEVLHIVILDPRGEVRMNEELPRRGVYSCMSWADREVRGLLAAPQEDWFVVRCYEHQAPGFAEMWRAYELSTGRRIGEFAHQHPRHSNEKYYALMGACPVRGTRLALLSWAGPGAGDVTSGSFTLVDLQGRTVWELSRPGAYTREQWHGLREGGGGAILRCDEPRRFDLWFVQEHARVTFEVAEDEAGGWRVRECQRAPYGRPAAEKPPEDVLGRLAVRHLGTIALEPPATPRPDVRDIVSFDVDDRGRLGVLRSDGARDTALVLVDPGGRVVRSIALRELLGDRHHAQSVTWLNGPRWLLQAAVSAGEVGGASVWRTRAWWVDVETGGVEEVRPFYAGAEDHAASTGDGGFVVGLRSTDDPSRSAALVSVGPDGGERWRARMPDIITGVTVTTDGRAIAGHGYSQLVFTTTADGAVERTVGERELLGGAEGAVRVATADRDGGLAVAVEDWDRGLPVSVDDPRVALWRLRRDGSVAARVVPRLPSGRLIELSPLAHGAVVRVASDGGLWVCDGQALVRLDDDGVARVIVGESPESDELRQVEAVASDLSERVCIVDAHTGYGHVYGADGKRQRVLRRGPDDLKQAGALHDVSFFGDGRVLLGGIEFSSAGERVGPRAPAGVPEPRSYAGLRAAQPNSGNWWVADGEELVLLDERDAVMVRQRRHADGRWLDAAAHGAVAPDGSLAVGTRGGDLLSVYDGDGTPLVTLAGPRPHGPCCGWERLAFSGRYVVDGPHEAVDWMFLAFDVGTSPPRCYTLGGLPPYKDDWHHVFARGGTELWLYAAKAHKIERFEIVGPDAARGDE